MTQIKAFLIAELLISYKIKCKLYREDGLWYVVPNKNCIELFGDLK